MTKQLCFLCFTLLANYPPSVIASTDDMYCTLMESESERCHFQSATSSYSLAVEGALLREKDNKSIVFKLPKKFYIESVHFKPLANKIIFTFSISDGDSGSVLISLFDEDKFSFEWQTELFAFNISPALVHNNSIYLGGIGVIAKINLDNGNIIWHHTGLYESETQAYNSFETPRVKDGYIIFTEQKVPDASYPGIREIQVL
ncbi:MAG: hypothetical protein ACN4GM_09720, partial [Gammaproteobacteria bacterium]